MPAVRFESNLDVLKGKIGGTFDHWEGELPKVGDQLRITTQKGELRFEILSKTWFLGSSPTCVFYVSVPTDLYKEEGTSKMKTLPKEWTDVYYK